MLLPDRVLEICGTCGTQRKGNMHHADLPPNWAKTKQAGVAWLKTVPLGSKEQA